MKRDDKLSVPFVLKILSLGTRWLGWFVGVSFMRLVSRSGGTRREGALVLRINYRSDLGI
jgi:hypothetical protein